MKQISVLFVNDNRKEGGTWGHALRQGGLMLVARIVEGKAGG